MAKVLSEKNVVDERVALAAMAYYPTLEEASVHLKEEYGMMVSAVKLDVHRRKNLEEYEKLCAQLAPRREAALANKQLDNAGFATDVIALAIERTRILLEEGRVADPSKVARDLADVQAKSIDKKLALEGRPSKIVETRNPEEILRTLESMGVLELVEGTAEEEHGC